MKTEFLLTQFYQKDCIAISFEGSFSFAFITPLVFMAEKPSLTKAVLSDYMSSQLEEPVFNDMLALVVSAADDYLGAVLDKRVSQLRNLG